MESKYNIKSEYLGREASESTGIKVLDKIIRYSDNGLELEADPRHAESVIKELGLEQAKACRTPGSKDDQRKINKACEDDEHEVGQTSVLTEGSRSSV